MRGEAKNEMESVHEDHFPDVRSYVVDVEIQWYDQQIRDGDVADIKYAVIPAAQLRQGSGADDSKQSDTDDTKDDIFFLDSFGEQVASDEKVEIEDGVKAEKEEDDATQDLVRGFELLMRQTS